MNKSHDTTAEKGYSFLYTALVPILMSIVAFLVYYPSLVYGFLFDDLPTITQYVHVRVFDPLGQFFSNPRWISRVLNQFTYKYWETNPFAYRMIDLMMHLLIGLMIFYTMLSLLSGLKQDSLAKRYAYLLSLMTTGLFLLHPVQTQTVSYITQMRLEGLVALFSFAVILSFVYAVKTSQNWLYALSFILAAFAAGTKEIVVVLPVLLVLVDWFLIAQGDWENFQTRLSIHVSYFTIVLGTMFYMGVVRPGNIVSLAGAQLHNNRGNILTSDLHEPITMFPFMISQFKVILHYLKIFVWPMNLSFDYNMKLSPSIFSLDVLVPLTLLAGMCWYAVRTWLQDKANLWVFGFAWFMVSILPRASIFPSTELVCDYKTYLGSFGMMFIIALGVVYLFDYAFNKIKDMSMMAQKTAVQVSFVLMLCVGLGLTAKERNEVWSSELAFWGDVAEKTNYEKGRVLNNFATAKWEDGQREEALKYYNLAINVDPNYAEPHINLGTIYQAQDNNEEALKHYARALEIGEAHPQLFNNLGFLQLAQNNYEVAEMAFRQALEINPLYSPAHMGMGKIYQHQGKLVEALSSFENALNGDVQTEELLYLHGTLCAELGAPDQALKSLQRLPKDYQDVSFQLASCYYNLGDYKNARANFDEAFKKDPNNVVCAYNYAQALLNLGEYDKALPLFAVAANDVPYAHLHIAKCLFGLGDAESATKELKEIIKLTQNSDLKKDCASLLQEINRG